MLGDDPEVLEDDNQFDFFQQSDSQVPVDVTTQESGDLEPLPYQGTQHEPSALARTIRTGRKINIPVLFRGF